MSLQNIMLGLLFGVCILAGGLAASWRFSIHPLWIPFVICVLVAFTASFTTERQRRAFLQRYWDRVCTGRDWKRRFPTASKAEIREFLDLFVAAFAFPRKRRLCFSPDDRVIDIYRTLYPSKGWGDALEMETLVDMLEKRYGVEVAKFGRDGITLGEIYEHTH